MQRLIVSLLLFTFTCFITSHTFASPEEDAKREDQSYYRISKNISLTTLKRENWGVKPKRYSKVVFPALQTEEEDDANIAEFNQIIAAFVQKQMDEFKTAVKNAAVSVTTNERNHYYLDYDAAFVLAKNTRFASIRFSTQWYISEMAHPSRVYQSFNYNLTTGQTLELADLFQSDNYLQVITDYVSLSLQKKLKTQFFKQDLVEDPKIFSVWNIKADGILFTFNEGSVAPRVFGAQTVLVPYKILKPTMREDSPLMACTSAKSRCLSQSVFLGSFVDESLEKPRRILDPVTSVY